MFKRIAQLYREHRLARAAQASRKAATSSDADFIRRHGMVISVPKSAYGNNKPPQSDASVFYNSWWHACNDNGKPHEKRVYHLGIGGLAGWGERRHDTTFLCVVIFYRNIVSRPFVREIPGLWIPPSNLFVGDMHFEKHDETAFRQGSWICANYSPIIGGVATQDVRSQAVGNSILQKLYNDGFRPH